MRYLLHSVADGVGKVVHRVDTPLIASDRVRRPLDSIQGRVSHVDVATTHVNFRPQLRQNEFKNFLFMRYD